MESRPRLIRVVLATLICVGLGLALPGPGRATAVPPTGPGLAQAATAMPKPLLGGWTSDMNWYASHVGAVQIYRMYDPGFNYPTWQQTQEYQLHGDAQADYSFKLPPADVAAGLDDAQLITFIASTPKNIILTNHHEPEPDITAGMYTAADYRAAIAHLATLVHAQNAADGGTRRVSVILQYNTAYGDVGRNPMDYWPGRDPVTGQNYADLISFDTYALPHNTNTPGVPVGFTDGVKWQIPKVLMDPEIAFAQQVGSPWMVSEFGYLEDVTDPTHKAQAITDFVNYARLKGAVAVEYFDGPGPRADWRLRYSTNATTAWQTIVNAP